MTIMLLVLRLLNRVPPHSNGWYTTLQLNEIRWLVFICLSHDSSQDSQSLLLSDRLQKEIFWWMCYHWLPSCLGSRTRQLPICGTLPKYMVVTSNDSIDHLYRWFRIFVKCECSFFMLLWSPCLNWCIKIFVPRAEVRCAPCPNLWIF